ncbi:MAG: hypothetical protein M3544_05785 [Pseudomonadota bacterium]|nr:hypothetical protein [Pseudomonadota bacterium]
MRVVEYYKAVAIRSTRGVKPIEMIVKNRATNAQSMYQGLHVSLRFRQT